MPGSLPGFPGSLRALRLVRSPGVPVLSVRAYVCACGVSWACSACVRLLVMLWLRTYVWRCSDDDDLVSGAAVDDDAAGGDDADADGDDAADGGDDDVDDVGADDGGEDGDDDDVFCWQARHTSRAELHERLAESLLKAAILSKAFLGSSQMCWQTLPKETVPVAVTPRLWTGRHGED